MEKNNYPEILGIRESLERYVNPLNIETYEKIFNIFVKDGFMQVFEYINGITSFESDIEQSEITILIKNFTARQALKMIADKYGIVFEIEEEEFKLNDIINYLNKLEYLIDVDTSRATQFLNIIQSEDDELSAMTTILEEIGFDSMFLLQYFQEFKIGYMDDYVSALREIVDNTDELFSSSDLLVSIEFNTTVSEIKNISKNYNIKCLSLAMSNGAFLTEESVLTELNKIDISDNSGDDYLAIEFLSAILLSKMDREAQLLSIYKEDILPGLNIPMAQQESIYKILYNYYSAIKDKIKGVMDANIKL